LRLGGVQVAVERGQGQGAVGVGGADALAVLVAFGLQPCEVVAGGEAGGVGDRAGVGFDGGGVVGEVVDAVEVQVFEQVLDAPAGAGEPDQRAGAGGGLGGEDLQRGLAAFEQGDLPAGSVVVDGDGLIGVADLGGLSAAGQGGADRQRGGGGELAA